MKSLYIIRGDACGDTKVNEICLLEFKQLPTHADKVLKIKINDGEKLIKDGKYKKLVTDKKVSDYEYDLMVRIKKDNLVQTWIKRNDLKNRKLYEVTNAMFAEGYGVSRRGFYKLAYEFQLK